MKQTGLNSSISLLYTCLRNKTNGIKLFHYYILTCLRNKTNGIKLFH